MRPDLLIQGVFRNTKPHTFGMSVCCGAILHHQFHTVSTKVLTVFYFVVPACQACTLCDLLNVAGCAAALVFRVIGQVLRRRREFAIGFAGPRWIEPKYQRVYLGFGPFRMLGLQGQRAH